MGMDMSDSYPQAPLMLVHNIEGIVGGTKL